MPPRRKAPPGPALLAAPPPTSVPVLLALNTTSGTGTPRSFAVTTASAAGDTLLVIVACNNVNANVTGLTDSKGNRYTVEGTSAVTPTTWSFRSAGATGGSSSGPTAALTTADTFSVACNGTPSMSVGLMAVAVTGAGPLDKGQFAVSNNALNYSAAVTPTMPGETFVSLCVNQVGGGQPALDPPFTELTSGLFGQQESCGYWLIGGPAGTAVTCNAVVTGAVNGRIQLWSFCAPLWVTTTTLPTGNAGTAYSAPLAASGGKTAYSWALASGALPTGLSVTGQTIAGTPAAGTQGTYTVTVRATDGNGTQATSSTLTLTVTPALVITAPGSLPAGTEGQVYPAQTFTATGGTPGYSWALTSGPLPAGLAFTTGGVLSGTPAGGSSGSYPVTMTVTDAAGITKAVSFTIVVSPPLAVTTATIPGGNVGTAYPSTTLATSGGRAPIAWAVTSGALPPGLALSSAGVITGNPTTAGSYAPNCTATDADGRNASKVLPSVIAPALVISGPASLPLATEAVAYSQAFTATGGTGPYSWVVWSGSLPSGLALSAAGLLSGTPAAGTAASYPATYRVTDALGVTKTTASMTLSVATHPAVTVASLPACVVGFAYPPTQLAATGGRTPYAWTTTGLPPGLALSSSGLLTGTPTGAGGSYAPVFTATDATPVPASATLPITINPPLSITSTSPLPPAQETVLYSAPLVAVGGTQPYAWTVSTGALPSGLAIVGNSIAGTPAVGAAGPYTVGLRVVDADTTARTQTFTLVVSPPPLVVTSTTLPDATIDQSYSAPLTATGGVPPYAWSATGLPSWLSLAGSILSGLPDAIGPVSFPATVTDAQPLPVTATCSLTVLDVPVAPPAPPPVPISVVWGSLDLNPGDRPDGVCAVVSNVDGWYGSPVPAGNDLARVLADGAVWGAKTLAARDITITGQVYGPRPLVLQFARDLANQAAARLPVPLAIGEDDGSGQFETLTAQVRADSAALTAAWTGRAYFDWQVTVTAADPRLYGETWYADTLSMGASGGTGRVYPWTPPRHYATADLPNVATLVNPGATDAPVWVTYTGPLGQCRLADEQAGTQIILAALTAGQQVLVNSETLTATAPGGSTRAGYLLAGSVPMLIPADGQAIWHLYGTGTGSLRLQWQAAYI